MGAHHSNTGSHRCKTMRTAAKQQRVNAPAASLENIPIASQVKKYWAVSRRQAAELQLSTLASIFAKAFGTWKAKAPGVPWNKQLQQGKVYDPCIGAVSKLMHEVLVFTLIKKGWCSCPIPTRTHQCKDLGYSLPHPSQAITTMRLWLLCASLCSHVQS